MSIHDQLVMMQNDEDAAAEDPSIQEYRCACVLRSNYGDACSFDFVGGRFFYAYLVICVSVCTLRGR